MELNLHGVCLFYDVYGEGEAIVLLHGNGEDHTYFDRQIAFLQENEYQVIVMDMRGHGQSTLGEEDLNFTVFAKDVYALLEHLQIAKAHVLGFSDGANTAMQFAITHPDKIISLLLYSGNLYPTGMKLNVFVAIYLNYLRQFFVFKNRRQKKQLLALMARHPHVSWECISSIQIPTLVIAGENDMIRMSHTQRIAEQIPHASLCILAGGDHFIARKQADVFNEKIYKFLKENAYGR